MRRTIKPFTVEMRSSRRKPSLHPQPTDQPAVDWPAALLGEQPAVDWPTAPLVSLKVAPEPQKPAGRILPVLEEAPTPPPDEPEALREPVEEPFPPEEPDEAPGPAMVKRAPAPVAPDDEPAGPARGRARLSRDAFGRGERWKARLPAAVHRKRRGVKAIRGTAPRS